MLLLMTNRKLHTRFRLVPKAMTLDDLERPFRTLFQNTCVWGAHHENFNEGRMVDPYYQRQRCSAKTIVSGNITFMRIFLGFLGDRGGVRRQRRFQDFRTLVAFPLTLKYMTLNDLEWPFYVKFSLLRTALSEIILHS